MSRKNRLVAVAEQQFLYSVKVGGDSSFKSTNLNVYIQDLLGAVNRGGSIKVNGDLYNFILKFEAVVRWILRWTFNVLS